MASDERGEVLVVDDDADMREALRYLIEANGHSVITAGNGEEALEMLRRGLRPCVILLDLMMPVKDGIQFRVEQRQNAAFADIPVVLLSGHYNPQHYAALLGAVAHLQKPILDLNQLLSIVHAHCKQPS